MRVKKRKKRNQNRIRTRKNKELFLSKNPPNMKLFGGFFCVISKHFSMRKYAFKWEKLNIRNLENSSKGIDIVQFPK
jgi:hypothetical protein